MTSVYLTEVICITALSTLLRKRVTEVRKVLGCGYDNVKGIWQNKVNTVARFCNFKVTFLSNSFSL